MFGEDGEGEGWGGDGEFCGEQTGAWAGARSNDMDEEGSYVFGISG